jgi:tRNA(fMet)-specific endonuclease VapC
VSFWVLDTDHVSLFQQNHPVLTQRINAVNPEDIGVTVITLEEQFYGRLNGIRRANSPEKLISAYAKLSATWNYFATVNLLDFDLDASNFFSELLRQKIRVGTQDLRIAAVVMSRNAILVTRNRRDFERVPGLRFEDWTI